MACMYNFFCGLHSFLLCRDGDDILQELLKPQEDINPLVQQILQAIFQVLELLVLRMLDDHLESGIKLVRK